MKTIAPSEENILKAYDKGSKEEKQLLTNLYGEELFKRKITDRVKTFKEACDLGGYDHDTMMKKSAFDRLELIIKVLNEGWKPDWSNSSQYKYYPWFQYVSGSGFVLYDFVYGCTRTSLGSRLVFKSRELAEHAATHFLPEYNDFLTIE